MFPPMEGGLPDHTDRLAEALSRHRTVTLLTSAGVDTAREFRVGATIRDWHDGSAILGAIESAVPAGPLLWQYVPHMYGRGGVNLQVPRLLRSLRARGRRQVVLAHEIAAPFSAWPHRSWYALAHRLMWRGVRRSAEAIGVSTAAWLARLDPTGESDRFFLAPSPANLGRVATGPDHPTCWRKAQGLAEASGVVGFFGSPGSGKQFDWVLAAWRAVRRDQPNTALAVIGGRPDAALSHDEERWFRALGYLPAVAASEALQALDLLVLPFVDGVSERRSSFMAGLLHGVPVMTTFGPATGRELRTAGCCAGVETTAGPGDFAAAAAGLARDREARGRLAACAARHYAAAYDWPRLAERLEARLRDVPPAR